MSRPGRYQDAVTGLNTLSARAPRDRIPAEIGLLPDVPHRGYERAFRGHDGLHKYSGHARYRAADAHDGRNVGDVIGRQIGAPTRRSVAERPRRRWSSVWQFWASPERHFAGRVRTR